MGVRTRLFVMMVLEIFIWGAWQPKIFSYMSLLGFEPWQQSLVGSTFGIASILGISVGAVKSHTSRGAAQLSEYLRGMPLMTGGHHG